MPPEPKEIFIAEVSAALADAGKLAAEPAAADHRAVNAPALSFWPTRALLAALFVLSALPYANAMLVIDSGRDLAFAWAIAKGALWPVYGPSIFATWQLGPWWFYALALPFALGGSLTVTALWIGAGSALKVVLAYRVGLACYGARGALLLAALVALPGWGSIDAMVINHTGVTETAVWAVLLASVQAWQRGSTAACVAAALLLSLALHAHPTALVAAPALALAIGRAYRRRPRAWLLPVCALTFALPLLPVLIAEALAGWPQFAATGQFVGGLPLSARLANLVPMAWGAVSHDPRLIADYLLPRIDAAADLVTMLWLGATLLAAAGLVAAIVRRDRLALGLGLQLAVAALFLVLLRDSTPAYMLLALTPLACWATAHGWLVWLADARAGRFGVGLAVLALVVGLAVNWQRQQVVWNGVIALPGATISDVKQPLADDALGRFWLPVRHAEPIARRLCGTTVHGELAAALAWGQGVAGERACARDALPRLGGSTGAAHVLGVPNARAAALGLSGGERVGGFHWFRPAAVLHPAHGAAWLATPEYPVDRYRRRAAQATPPLQLMLHCPAGQWLIVSNLMPGLNTPFTVRLGSAEAPLAPALASFAAQYFRCPQVATMLPLRVDVIDADAVDVALLE